MELGDARPRKRAYRCLIAPTINDSSIDANDDVDDNLKVKARATAKGSPLAHGSPKGEGLHVDDDDNDKLRQSELEKFRHHSEVPVSIMVKFALGTHDNMERQEINVNIDDLVNSIFIDCYVEC